MGFKRLFKNNKGIALMLVLSVVTVLAVLVTEFTYLSQVNQRMAHGRLDSIRAHYLGKSALKLALLRLKAYQTVKGFLGSEQGSKLPIPRQLVDQIWSFPLVFPLPTTLPGLSASDKERIEEFHKESSMEGGFVSKIESESSKYNLNLLLANFVPPEAEKKEEEKKNNNNQNQNNQNQNQNQNNQNAKKDPKKDDKKEFNAEQARESLKNYLLEIYNNKIETDEDFADQYSDLRFDELMANIFAWADLKFEIPSNILDAPVKIKRAPFYSLSELHMIPEMDDTLYDLFAPSLTVSTTPGINVNTMTEITLRALLPGISDEEVIEFFEFRDDPEQDQKFKDADGFFKYIEQSISSIGSIDEFKNELNNRNIRIVTDESEFKITIQAEVGTASKLIEAKVSLVDDKKKKETKKNDKQDQKPQPDQNRLIGAGPNRTNTGLKITFLRIK